MEIKKQVLFRPTQYDIGVLAQISDKNPHIQDTPGLIREALRVWEIEATDTNSKGKRLARIEEKLDKVLEK